MCPFVVTIWSGSTGGDGSNETSKSAHYKVVDCTDAEGCGIIGGSTWEWCGLLVPVILYLWDANVLAISLNMLLRKHMGDQDVGLIVVGPDRVDGLLV